MLKNLCIENIAVIERADIAFMDGFHVLSGETGAGKSIIIDSIHAILGARMSRDLIRNGQNRACVTALFADLPEKTKSLAESLGVAPEDGQLLLRRELYGDGRNLCRINGQPATLSMLKALGETLIRIHGQHDGQHLLNELLHIDYLDAFAALGPQLATYQSAYETLLALNRRIRNLSLSTAEKEQRRKLLPEDILLLKQANVQPGEQDDLLVLRSQLRMREQAARGLEDALRYLDDGEGVMGAATMLSMAESSLSVCEKHSDALKNLRCKAKELFILCQDLSGDMTAQLNELGYSDAKLDETEKRLDKIQSLVRRFGIPADELAEYCSQLEQELDELEHFDDHLEALEEQYTAQRKTVYELASALHERRVAAAEEISLQIQRELADLDLQQARFVVEIQDLKGAAQTKFTKKGTDNVRFLLSANAGEEVKPLSKVASGGELSRIMLALKHVLSAGEEGVTMIFDEIDTGVSGRAANQVGRKLYSIASGRQVLCVTHLPQIACLADHQYYIRKYSEDDRTYTSVAYLDLPGRARELARLTAGSHISQTILDSAYELLRQAELEKKQLTTGAECSIIKPY